MIKYFSIVSLGTLLVLSACRPADEGADAYGRFEAEIIQVAPEMGGKILQLTVEEGKQLAAGELVAVMDTTQLHLKKMQLLASLQSLTTKTQDAQPQIDVLLERRRVLLREQERITALVAANAATTQQLDELNGQLKVLEKEIKAAKSKEADFNQALLSERDPMSYQIRQVEDQIRRCYIYNPQRGTVLVKLATAGEMAAPGRPLYHLADLSSLELRAYITGDQLPWVSLGQEVEVLIDQSTTENQSLAGTVSWIASEAEFTPKIVQTKEERVNLVYAVKIRVANDGRLKIGMPGEVVLPKNNPE